MITAQQMRAARALAGIDQKTLAERAGVSLPTIQRMEASEDVVRGVVDTLVKVIRALEESGVELIGVNQASAAGAHLVDADQFDAGFFQGANDLDQRIDNAPHDVLARLHPLDGRQRHTGPLGERLLVDAGERSRGAHLLGGDHETRSCLRLQYACIISL